ncbi:MAG TPA: bis(5'-nucleosyl)-tetraphosphatase (symmetrical) YqeK [Bacillota bacterium]|nr:bis(5'-nucleosyl)-tetraphosphatase (symmetrical) YqeK [Bacillota bacterium]
MIKPEYMGILRALIDKKRLRHSVNVSKYAGKLAELYGADVKKAELVGMIHDCAKCLPYEKMLELCKGYSYEPDEIAIKSRALLHAPLGAYLAADMFGIKDMEVIKAIRCHTTGKRGMSLLEKVICLADHIEPMRTYPGVDEIRECAQVDINKALLMAFESSIDHVIKKGGLLHPASIDARNDIILLVTGQEPPRFKKGGK